MLPATQERKRHHMNRKFEIEIDKPDEIQPGSDLQIISIDADGKITARVKTEDKANQFVGLYADKREELQSLVENAMKDRERLTRNKRKMSEVLAGYQGGLFKDAQEVDEFLKAERDSWER
jgi:hypothetical protein